MARHRVILSSVDQLMPTSYIRLFLVIRANTTDFDSAIEQLRHGLTRTQQQLPYIGGAVFKTTSNRIGIEWEDDGRPPPIQIVSTPTGFPSTSELESARHPFGEIWRLGGSSDRFGEVEIRDGLPAVSITCSSLDGYMVLGVSCFHSLWDIAGLSIFFHLWSRNTRKPSDAVSLPIIEDLECREGRLRQSLAARALRGPTSFRTNLEAFSTSAAAEIRSCTLQFDISRLKALSHQISSKSGKSVSANDLAIAAIWTAISLARVSSDGHSVAIPRLRVLVDGRKHVFQPKELTVPYLGNLALPLFSLFTGQDAISIAQRDLASVLVAAISAVLSSSNQASAKSFVEAISTLDEALDASAIRETSAVYNTEQLTSTSWSQAPMYVDFGARVGKVEYVRIAPDDYKLEGMILTLPRKRDGSDGSNNLEIFVALQADDLQGLQESEMIRSLIRSRPDGNETTRAKI